MTSTPERPMSRLLNGWFSEICPMWPGMALSVEIEEHLFSHKSRIQQIDLYKTRTSGIMLVLDGIIQLTEKDEFIYHEMMAHVPAFSHPCPETALVVGGGDGGVVRELLKHESIRTIDCCEIDPRVVEVSVQFLPSVASGLSDPRVSLIFEDGAAFVRQCPGRYDLIIVDSSDPVGAGEALFRKVFYRDVRKALKPGGIVAAQGESIFLHPAVVQDLSRVIRETFDRQAYCWFSVQSFPGGSLGVNLGSLGPDVSAPARVPSPSLQAQLSYYSSSIHRASFVLPAFARRLLTKGTAP